MRYKSSKFKVLHSYLFQGLAPVSTIISQVTAQSDLQSSAIMTSYTEKKFASGACKPLAGKLWAAWSVGVKMIN